jgi:hypothetical protein
MHWQFYKNIHNEVLFSNTNWKHHPCPFHITSHIISSILQCGHQGAHITLVSNSSTGFHLQLFILSTCPYQMYLLVSKFPPQSFTIFIPLPPWVNYSCQYAVTAEYTTEFYPQNNFFPIHLQIVELFMCKWKCAFLKDL